MMDPLGIDDMKAMHDYHREFLLRARRPRRQPRRSPLPLVALLRSALAAVGRR